VLENKLAEAKSKKETLKARAASAKTSKQIQEMMGSLDTSNASVAFDRMEEKVGGAEALLPAEGPLSGAACKGAAGRSRAPGMC
jgi:phage shock protein A